MRFCDKLSAERKKNNYSQEQLADKMGVSRQAVSKWESGVSYPDMEKMLQLCEILNCNLEDLMDDGKIGKTSTNKFNFNKYLDDFLKFITKTYNMFCSMTAKNIFLCILEMVFIFLMIMLFGHIALSIANTITTNIIDIVPFGYLNFLKTILNAIYSIIVIIVGVIVFIHLFKIRYLDYYVTIEDNCVNKKQLEKPIKESMTNNKHEKIIIRDPKHASLSFFDLLGKIIVLCIKCFIFIIALFVALLLLGLLFSVVVSICYIKYSTLFLYSALGFIGAGVISYVFIELMFKFIFDRKQNLKRCFILFLGGLVVLAFGCGFFFNKIMTLKYVGFDDNKNVKNISEVININNDTIIDSSLLDFNDIVYVNDESLTDKAKIEVIYCDTQDIAIKNNNDNYYYIFMKDRSFNKIYKQFLKDLKSGIIRTYDGNNIKVKIYTNQNNYDILANNYKNINK